MITTFLMGATRHHCMMHAYILSLALVVLLGGCAAGPAQRREAYQPSYGDTQKNLTALLSLPEIARYHGKLDGRVYEGSYGVKYGPRGYHKAIITDRKIVIDDEIGNTVFSKEYRVKPKHFQAFNSSFPHKAISEPIDYAEITKVLIATFDDTHKKNLLMSMKTVHLYGIGSEYLKEIICESIVDGITDEKVLIALAYHITEDNTCSATCQMRLINRIADQKALSSLLKHAHDMFVRQAIIEKITDKTLLIDIAKNDKDVSVRKKALMKITDKDVLTDLEQNDRDESIRNAAKKRLDGL